MRTQSCRARKVTNDYQRGFFLNISCRRGLLPAAKTPAATQVNFLDGVNI